MALPSGVSSAVRLHLHRKTSVVLGLLDELFPYEFGDSEMTTEIVTSVLPRIEVAYGITAEGREAYTASFQSANQSWHTYHEEYEP